MATKTIHEEIAAGRGEPLSRACRRFPSYRGGRPVTLSCLVRWITSGVRGSAGELIRLEAARLAGRWITTPGAIERFIAAQSPDSDATSTPTPRSPTRRQRQSDAAARHLENLGI